MFKNYLIIGSGQSAIGAAKLLKKLGHSALFSDIRQPTPQNHQQIKELGFAIQVGPQTRSTLEGIDRVILSPGIPLSAPICEIAQELNIPIQSEIDLALSEFKGKQICVTGTNGKSTTVTLLNHLLTEANISSLAAGNLGKTPSEVIASENTPDNLVLELSSYQLELSQNIRASVAIFTSFSPDHLERHKTLKAYLSAKWNLAKQVIPGGVIILASSFYKALLENNFALIKTVKTYVVDDSEVLEDSDNLQIARFKTDQSCFSLDGRSIKLDPNLSRHDNLNLMFCILAIKHLFPTLDYDAMVSSAHRYERLEHRFESFANSQGYPIINDSKSTNVESTCVALRSMTSPCYLLLGGKDKGSTYKEILDHKDIIKKAFFFGEARNRIQDELTELSSKSVSFLSLKEALDCLCKDFQEQPAPILFSPACSSFDEFLNFEERGLYFKKEISKKLRI